MEKILIDPTSETPKVVLDKDSNKIEISGNSLPEDVNSFYTPILSWFDEYSASPNVKTEVILNFEYYNTSSSKMILKILEKFKEIHRKGFDVEVQWHYMDDDEDMIEAGEDYSEHVKVPFKFVSHQRRHF